MEGRSGIYVWRVGICVGGCQEWVGGGGQFNIYVCWGQVYVCGVIFVWVKGGGVRYVWVERGQQSDK